MKNILNHYSYVPPLEQQLCFPTGPVKYFRRRSKLIHFYIHKARTLPSNASRVTIILLDQAVVPLSVVRFDSRPDWINWDVRHHLSNIENTKNNFGPEISQ